MTCLIKKTCAYYSGNCNPAGCGFYLAQLSEYVSLPKDFKPVKETGLPKLVFNDIFGISDEVIDDIAGYWENGI